MRVGHCQLLGSYFVDSDVGGRPAIVPVLTPAVDNIRLGTGSGVAGLAFDNRQAIDMAAVLTGQLRDETAASTAA